MAGQNIEHFSRHERALLRRLDMETRVTDLEDADDDTQAAIQDLARAVNRLTWAIGSAMFTLICVLITAVITQS